MASQNAEYPVVHTRRTTCVNVAGHTYEFVVGSCFVGSIQTASWMMKMTTTWFCDENLMKFAVLLDEYGELACHQNPFSPTIPDSQDQASCKF